jgi:thiol-disulfide isomerase/thioredoxin
LRFVEKSSRVTMFVDQERGTICELLISPTDPSDKWDLTVTYQKVDVNKPVDAGKFKITKPEGARLVDRISFTRQFDYPRNGNRIPDFDIGVLGSDRKASVKSFLGKNITFVTFWATWCPPCRAELPILEELYKHYRDQGFEVVGINLDTDSDLQTIKKSADELGITFPVLLDSRARYARELLVQNIPTLLILNSEGKIMEAHVGTSPDVRKELSEIIENAISKSPAASKPIKK